MTHSNKASLELVPANRYVVFFSFAMVGCAADLLTKSWALDALGMPGGKSYWLWEDVIGFTTSLNEGALFGYGQGWGILFASLSVVAALAIVYWLFVARAARDLLLTISLGCVTAGILGNLYDRLGLHGLIWPVGIAGHEPGSAIYAVRDFIDVGIGQSRWPTFNIADSLLVCGAALLFWRGFICPENVSGQTTRSPENDNE